MKIYIPLITVSSAILLSAPAEASPVNFPGGSIASACAITAVMNGKLPVATTIVSTLSSTGTGGQAGKITANCSTFAPTVTIANLPPTTLPFGTTPANFTQTATVNGGTNMFSPVNATRIAAAAPTGILTASQVFPSPTFGANSDLKVSVRIAPAIGTLLPIGNYDLNVAVTVAP